MADPVANNDVRTIAESANSAPGVFTGNVIANDRDADADVLIVSALNGAPASVGVEIQGLYGVFILLADGRYTYRLDNTLPIVNALSPSDTFTETFTYTIADPAGGQSTATLSLTVRGVDDAPVAIADSVSSVVGGAAATGNVLANDFDPEGAPLSVTTFKFGASIGTNGAALAGRYGALTLQADGSYVYAVDEANAAVVALAEGATLTENFSVTVSDGGKTATRTLTVFVVGANDAPLASDDLKSLTEDTTQTTGNLLSNDVDPDRDAKRVIAVDGEQQSVGVARAGLYGTLTLNADGSYAYVLDRSLAAVQGLSDGETLQDVFAYTMADPSDASSSANLIITITGRNDAPTVVADTASAQVQGAPAIGNVLDNDVDVDGDTLTVTGVSFGALAGALGEPLAGRYGALTLQSDGAFVYTPDESAAAVIALGVGKTLLETFTVTVSDGAGGVVSRNLVVTLLGANDGPTAVADVRTMSEDSTRLTGNVRSNDTDPDRDVLTIVEANELATNVGAPIAGAYGALTLNADGGYEYVLNRALPTVQGLASGETLSDVFSYTVADPSGARSTGFTGLTVGVAPTLTLGTAALGAGSQFVYDTDTGLLLWDADGEGGDAGIEIAVLGNRPLLNADDFLIG
jgi:VCBS repeat-containing protein